MAGRSGRGMQVYGRQIKAYSRVSTVCGQERGMWAWGRSARGRHALVPAIHVELPLP